jgi:hypothetical protein
VKSGDARKRRIALAIRMTYFMVVMAILAILTRRLRIPYWADVLLETILFVITVVLASILPLPRFAKDDAAAEESAHASRIGKV